MQAAAKSPAKPKATKKVKKEKDPNAPKRALGSYMFFAADKRGAVSCWGGVIGGVELRRLVP